MVDPQGFEPQMTEPKSVVLPLHHGSLFILVARNYKKYFIEKIFCESKMAVKVGCFHNSMIFNKIGNKIF